MTRHSVPVIGLLLFMVAACLPVPVPADPLPWTPTPTDTMTATGTATPTPYSTGTPTDTPTWTATSTGTPTATLHPTGTPTDTPTWTTTSTGTPTETLVPTSTVTITATGILQPSETSTSTSTPLTPAPCETASGRVDLSVSPEYPKVGDAVHVTVRFSNEGCLDLGLPQYRLYIQSDASVLDPPGPEPVVHYLAVSPGASDAAGFELQAVAGGQASLTATVSYEVHIGYPGPAYWGMSGSGTPMLLNIMP